MTRKVIWIAGILAVGVAIGGYVFFSGERKIPVRYKTVPVEWGAIVSVVNATGTINPVTMVQVGSQVTGMVESLHADFNSVVKKNDVVARIDPFPYRARRDQASANLANAKAAVLKSKADLLQRKRELDRVQSLITQQFVSQNDVDVAVTAHEGAMAQLAVAEAAVKQAQAALEAAELDLTYTVIKAPIDGIVISRLVEVGQRINASMSIPVVFMIAQDLTKMQVNANVSEADIGGITEGKEVAFTVDAYPGQRFQGKIRQVRNSPISVQNVVTYDVVVDVDNTGLQLKPGMTANVSIVVARKDDTLKVPNSALRFVPPKMTEGAGGSSGHPGAAPLKERSGAKTVWKMNVSGDPKPVAVQTGISDGLVTEITSGDLKEGDSIIVGLEALKSTRSNNLPPGFGGGGPHQPRRPGGRDRGL
ncbi:MAG: efflux RND transporter periplasmic adaptor subunit [Nitrospira sp.]